MHFVIFRKLNRHLLIHKHLEKVRKLEPPKAGKLASFVPFGTAVEQLCEHMKAAELKQHLVNPLLIQDLVDKFPDNEKREWVRYKSGKKRVTLRIFSNFISEIVSDACEANVCLDYKLLSKPVAEVQPGKGTKEKGAVYSHREGSSGVDNEERRKQKPCERTDHRLRYCEDFKKLPYVDRMKIVDRFKLCLNAHGTAQCKFKLRCNVGECREAHNTLLHPVQRVVSAHIRADSLTLFRMIPVNLHCGERTVTVLVFLDEGASVTLMEKSLVDRLGAVGIAKKLTIKWTADIARLEESRRLNLWASALGADEKLLLKTVRTVGKLMLPQQKLNAEELSDQYAYMRGLPIASYNGRPEMLIGLNNIHTFAPIEAKIGSVADPIAVRCKLGWTVYGPRQANAVEASGAYLGVNRKITNESLHDLLKTHYALEESVPSDGLEEVEAVRKEAGKGPGATPKRCRQIDEYHEKGYPHLATAEELAKTEPGKVWYLPLNVVQNPKKPEKVRLIWDAAADVQGVSLNSKLLKGPDMLVPLMSVLVGFRERRIAFGGDVRQMYHQLQMIAQDKRFLRFLFRKNVQDPPSVYVMDVATFGSTSSPCSAQFVKNRNAEEFAGQYPEAAAAIIHRHYVDNNRAAFEGVVRCSLVMSLSKVAPLKRQSVPRLELMAAVGARLSESILTTHTFKIDQCVFWTDSKTVCSWIRSDQHKFKQFVAFRIGEILELTRAMDWRWISAKLNIADVLTKWSRNPILQSNSEWFTGPSFLHQSEDQWPSTDTQIGDTTEEHMDCDRKKNGRRIITTKATEKQRLLIKAQYSSVHKPLSQEEFQKTEIVLWKQAQFDGFPDEMSVLTTNLTLKPGQQPERIARSSSIYKLTPVLDQDGILRMGGRMETSTDMPFDKRFPIILPRKLGLTGKLIQVYHEKFGHAIRETVVNELRQRFWIPNIRSTVFQVTRQCIWCKLHRCLPVVPRMSPLSIQRVTIYLRPFSVVGIDYLGPIEVTVRRKKMKR
ncbi:uncharacterized protein LOC128746343 [Sabethes cyaneus]|uniref:uncharacterized protein LOC128746343 n=1 Tax=Sabethes cyaneus TaxID=53552 RepID=UPI00237D386B|nr:uncharacterized protein LOC128746343 [Sabethes cyaneus]